MSWNYHVKVSHFVKEWTVNEISIKHKLLSLNTIEIYYDNYMRKASLDIDYIIDSN